MHKRKACVTKTGGVEFERYEWEGLLKDCPVALWELWHPAISDFDPN